MSVLSILEWPDRRLVQPCHEVQEPFLVAALIPDLFDTMYAASGRGLAAPQVGKQARVFVMDAGWKTGARTPLACINPVLRPLTDERMTGEEACLSVPGVSLRVARFAEVELAYTDVKGASHRVALSGAEAVIAQHECDHLDGTMHFDRVSAAERADLLARYGVV
ncbi:MAG: peptide deformylase [Paracoccaceae bacterium]|nr:peptide deformylase [Paracoccaceae bacterium]